MKTLENQTLFYDEDCPLCKVYTLGFIRGGMLDKNGRTKYSQMSSHEENLVDIKRSCNEIALLNHENGTVIYGIDSLLKIIGNSFPIIEKVGKIQPVHSVLKQLYSFISYNRKVIIPNNSDSEARLKCIPDFNFTYRLLYLIIGVMSTSFILSFFLRDTIVIFSNSIISMAAFVTGLLVFQGICIHRLDNKTILNYLGNLMTTIMMGNLILSPIVIANHFLPINQIGLISYFFFAVILAQLEHNRRVTLLKLPNYLTFSWIIYLTLIILTSLI